MPPPPGHLPTRIKGFYDCHMLALSLPTRALPPQRVDKQEYIYHITLGLVASIVPQQCVPLCPDSSSKEQSDSIARSNCIKCHPSTFFAPTTTAWALNHAFSLPLYIQKRCCNPLCTVHLSAAVHQCNVGLCAPRTPWVLCWMTGKSTGDVAPNKARAPSSSDTPCKYESLWA